MCTVCGVLLVELHNTSYSVLGNTGLIMDLSLLAGVSRKRTSSLQALCLERFAIANNDITITTHSYCIWFRNFAFQLTLEHKNITTFKEHYQ